MPDRDPNTRTEEQTRAIVRALEAMARGEAVGEDGSQLPARSVAKDSPLRRTQSIRISGRTIRSGLE